MGHRLSYKVRGGAWRRRRGFTAFEALLASMILAMVGIAVGSALMAGRQQSALAQKTAYASLIGRALMDEILRLPCGSQANAPDANETYRSNITTLAGYNKFTDGPNNLTDLAGNLYPREYQELTRSVTVTSQIVTPASWSSGVSGDMVTVTVSLGGHTLVTLQRFISPS